MTDSPNDKEQFICLNCHQTVELDEHGRCPKCQSEKVMSESVFAIIKSAAITEKIIEAHERITGQSIARKPLRWWHFVYGPFETFVSNYRVKDLEEAKKHVCLDGYEWSVRRGYQGYIKAVLDNREILPLMLDNVISLIEDLSNDEFNEVLAQKHRRVNASLDTSLDTDQAGKAEAQGDGSGSKVEERSSENE